jgi:hypothetical protein
MDPCRPIWPQGALSQAGVQSGDGKPLAGRGGGPGSYSRVCCLAVCCCAWLCMAATCARTPRPFLKKLLQYLLLPLTKSLSPAAG